VDVSVVSSKVKDIILCATIDLHNNYFLSKCGACKLQREKCIFILSKPKMLFEIPRLVHWTMINLIMLFEYRKCVVLQFQGVASFLVASWWNIFINKDPNWIL
jgi:hypothetical protein